MAVARVLEVIARGGLLGYPGWLLRCCHAVARVFAMWLLGYYGWLLGCCYAVARVIRQVARVLLCGC